MNKKYRILILGDGRIGRAVADYFKLNPLAGAVSFISDQKEAANCDLLVGALPGELGEKGLDLALRYKKNLIDISDVDPPFYLKAKSKIEKAAITVVPGCGFSPGLVNCILGYESLAGGIMQAIEVKAGSLSRKDHYYPFLWCFEDLILEHQIPSWQMVQGKKKQFPAFAGYKKEKFFGIQAESYYCASGFENLLDSLKVRNFSCKVIRPYGFREFFYFLQNQGFLQKENIGLTKSVLEKNLQDNITFSEVTVLSKSRRIVWLIKSFSKSDEKLNSMQKITAIAPAIIGKFLLANKIRRRGLVFMEDIGRQTDLFPKLVGEIRKEGIIVNWAVKKI